MPSDDPKDLKEIKKTRKLGGILFWELQLISSDLHAPFLPHELQEQPDAVVWINSVNRRDEIGKRSSEYFDTVPLIEAVWWQQYAWGITSEHKARDKLKRKWFWFAVKAHKSGHANCAVDAAPRG